MILNNRPAGKHSSLARDSMPRPAGGISMFKGCDCGKKGKVWWIDEDGAFYVECFNCGNLYKFDANKNKFILILKNGELQ